MPTFRLFIISQLSSVTAIWIQRITQDWLVMELTGSASIVGLLVLVQLGPSLVFGLLGGLIVDRYSKRMLIMVSQSVMGASGLTLAILLWSGNIEVWHIFLLASIVGMFSVVEHPARMVYVGEMVGPSLLRNAVSTNAATFQLSGMIGPAVAGILIATAGFAWGFGVTFALATVSIFLLSFIKASTIVTLPRAPKAKGQTFEAFRYVKKKPVIFWIFTLLIFFSVLSQSWAVILAPFADNVFNSGASGYGAYNSSIAAGALIGALISMRRVTLRLRTFVFMLLGGISLRLLASFAPNETIFMVTIAFAGMCMVLMWTAANPLLQFSSNPMIRGRIMAMFLIIANGGEAIGAPMLGALADYMGARSALLITTSVALASAITISFLIAKNGNLKIQSKRGNLRPRIVPRDATGS